MNNLAVGDTVENINQRAIVRWLGSINDTPMIGLQSIDVMLPGYTDGTCPFDNIKHFECSKSQGYYVLEKDFMNWYKIISRKDTIYNHTTNSTFLENPSLIPETSTTVHQQPIQSISTPSISQIQHSSGNDINKIETLSQSSSSSRGIRSRLVSQEEKQKLSSRPFISNHNDSFTPAAPRPYCPANYKSPSCDRVEHSKDDETSSNVTTNDSRSSISQFSASISFPQFGHEYFLDDHSLSQIKSLLESQTSTHHICLNIIEDHSNIQDVINEQINQIQSRNQPVKAPNDICIEISKVFECANVVYPMRSLSLYNNDYLLLAILCSNNQCAYIRTLLGWAYIDDRCDSKQPIISVDISQMIDGCDTNIYPTSEQCQHVLKNSSFLYYKLV